MANILRIFTAIILAVAAFVAIKNNAKLEEEIDNRKDRQVELAEQQKILRAAQEVLKALPVERAGVDELFAAKSKEEANLREVNADMKSEIERKTADLNFKRAEVDEIKTKTANSGEMRDVAKEMRSSGVELKELAQSIADNEASLANLADQITATKADATKRKEEFELLSKGESLPALKTSIRSIYPTWGFVTLNDGNNAGVNSNSTLDVVRDGETIARLLVTAVESRSASASIIPDSLAADVTLMVGDRVMPASKDSKEKKSVVN